MICTENDSHDLYVKYYQSSGAVFKKIKAISWKLNKLQFGTLNQRLTLSFLKII